MLSRPTYAGVARQIRALALREGFADPVDYLVSKIEAGHAGITSIWREIGGRDESAVIRCSRQTFDGVIRKRLGPDAAARINAARKAKKGHA